MEEKLTQLPSNCLKIVLFGPESTGKSTLAEKLALHYKTIWVKEFMREYLQKKWDETKGVCEPYDLMLIARGQMQLENELSLIANNILFCDTDLLQLKVYSEAYYNGYCNPVLHKHALKNWYDLYFLTNIDTPWVPDDLRDKPHDRDGMFRRFHHSLLKTKRPFVILKGDEDQRLETAIKHIDELLKQKN
jgi:NadR type nicotinamide-nucleotide adenylyltransferase